MQASWKHWIVGAALGCGLLAGSPPARCADEAAQSQLLKQLFRTTEPEWLPLMKENTGLLDQSFFDRVDTRIRWAAENNQVDDAIRFALVADTACTALGRVGGYRLGLVQVFQKVGNDELARQLIENILLTNPEMAQARFMKAIYLRSDGNFADAETEFTKCMEQGYRTAECNFAIAQMAFLLEKLPKAKEYVASALRIDPNHPGALQLRETLDRLAAPSGVPFGDVAVAPTKQPTIEPAKYSMYLRTADAALRGNKLTEAEQNYKLAISANPNDGTPRIYLGALYYRMGNMGVAKANLWEGLRRTPKSADGWRYLGCACERDFDKSQKKEDLEQAKDAYKKALQLQPGDVISQMGLERLNGKTPKNSATSQR